MLVEVGGGRKKIEMSRGSAAATLSPRLRGALAVTASQGSAFTAVICGGNLFPNLDATRNARRSLLGLCSVVSEAFKLGLTHDTPRTSSRRV